MSEEEGKMEFKISGGNPGAEIYMDHRREENGILLFDVHMVPEREEIPESFCISFRIPDVDIYSTWSPSVRFDRRIKTPWAKPTTRSRLSSWMPMHALVSAAGQNRMTVAVSDAETPISLSTCEYSDDACIQWEITFFTVPVAPVERYKATLRIDTRDIPYYDAVYDTVSWWERACGYPPAYVPEHAKLPVNSLWYSYHQRLDAEDILRECALSKELGMDTVIVDDGWQTDDDQRGYHFCGDWEVEPSKIPDMQAFVKGIHATGMKAMLWFSVPFMGIKAKRYDYFRDMLLDQTGNQTDYFSLDPRYKEVRDYLVGIYAKAVAEWGFDGLKLDFIDSFVLKGKSLDFDARRDHESLEAAVDALMAEVADTLRGINPEVMIEFRQSYVGPAIRKYGNMLRVGDCPNDALRNRMDIINLRLTSGNTAVHSDMIMWNREDSVESAARQFASILYSVPQISVKLATLPHDHKKMLAFYLSFWRKNRDILINGKLRPSNPESVYSIVCAEKDGNAVFTAYTDPLIDCGAYGKTMAVNATRGTSLILKGAEGKAYQVLDCMGNVREEGTVKGNLCELRVPPCGIVQVG